MIRSTCVLGRLRKGDGAQGRVSEDHRKGAGRLEENNLCKGPEGKRTWESDDGGRPSMAGGIVSGEVALRVASAAWVCGFFIIEA